MKVFLLLLVTVLAMLSATNCEIPVKCILQHDPGECKAAEPRYYYDVQKDSCIQFNYGGRSGNSNRFESEDECLTACGRTNTIFYGNNK